MKISLGSLLKALCLMILISAPFAGRAEADDPWLNYDEAMFMDMDLDENIATPKLQSNEERQFVRSYMRGVASDLVRKKFTVDLDRDDEVVVVTVPTDRIFLPNDTLLSPRAPGVLNPLLSYMKDAGIFKIVYTVHTDNTGSKAYNNELSQQRVNSLYDWMLDNVNEDIVIIPYAMGDSEPVADNDTRKGRAENRRVEFYFIPGPDLILQGRK